MRLQQDDLEKSSRWSRLKAQWQRLGYYEITILLGLLIVVGGAWGFVKLADEVVEGETHWLDEKILLSMRNPNDRADPIGAPWVEEMGRDLTALGGTAVLTLLSCGVVGYLLLARKYSLAWLVLCAIGGGILLNWLLKQGFSRPRPDLVPHGSYVYDSSFPSGHSMDSAATYLTLGALLARIQPKRRLKVYILAWSVALTGLVGVSRVYLGVHWPTDVLGGWTAGAVWAMLCWLVARWLQKRGQIAPTGEDRSGESTAEKLNSPT